MRSRVVAAVTALVLVGAFGLTGCGGGGEEAAAPTAAPAAAPAAPVAPGAATEKLIDNSPTETVTFEPFKSPEKMPVAIQDRLEIEQPMLLLFVDSAQKTTDDQKSAVSTVMREYRGLIDLITFDVGEYATTNATGSISVDPDILKDENAKLVAFLTQAVGVRYTPYIIIVDEQGYITWRGNGYVDEGTLGREVLRATR